MAESILSGWWARRRRFAVRLVAAIRIITTK